MKLLIIPLITSPFIIIGFVGLIGWLDKKLDERRIKKTVKQIMKGGK